MSLPTKEKIYGNCKVLHPDGSLMFRCDTDRVDWYVSRNLADIVSADGDSITIRFNFTPRGRGHIDDPFYLQEKKNQCVVCGGEEHLTRHHAVPFCYRKHFPEHMKSRCCHDVLPVCVKCHEKYEKEAIQLKKQFAGMNDVSDKLTNRSTIYARSAANALYKHSASIPAERQEILMKRVAFYLEKDEVTQEDIVALATLPNRRGKYYSHGLEVVNKLEDLSEFIKMWRRHFVETMNPQFMPEHWDVDKND
jgi:hypothetical protein